MTDKHAEKAGANPQSPESAVSPFSVLRLPAGRNFTLTFGILAVLISTALFTACPADSGTPAPDPDPRYVYSKSDTSTFTLRFADGIADGVTNKNGTVSGIVIYSADNGGPYTADIGFTYSVSGTTLTITWASADWNTNWDTQQKYLAYEINRLANNPANAETDATTGRTFTKSGENLTGTNCTFTYKE